MRRAAAALAALVAACSTPVDDRPGPLVPGPGGFEIGATGLEIGFGRAEDGAIAAASRVIGSPPVRVSEPADCGGLRTAHWVQGLSMTFRDRAFVGWSADGPGFETALGLAPGDRRSDVQALGGRFDITTLGEEFEAGGVRGVLTPKGTVTLLYSGQICAFR